MAKTKVRSVRVGFLVAVALTVLMLFLFFIGSEQKIFARKNSYDVELDQAAGLAQGNPVKMSGVTIGVIGDIQLPSDPRERNVGIKLLVDRKYAERIRGDSRVRLKKLGLLTGDSYIDVTPGTPRFDQLPPGAMIPAQRQANVDQLLSSGEDLVDNFVQMSYSLKNILGRVDRGEGLLGEITSTPETKQRLTDTLLTTLNKTNAILARVESGKGTIGKLVYDDKYGQQLTGSLSAAASSLQSVTASVQRSFENNTGTIPALLSDPQGKEKVLQLVENLSVASKNLATFSTALESGEGLVPRLLGDKVYADQALNEFSGLLTELNQTVQKINAGEGTAGKIIADPSVYESLNDILIGINESRMLRWLIRNRQQKGIEKRFDEEQKTPAPAPVKQPDVRTQITPPEPTKPPVVPPTTGPASNDSAAATTTQGPPD